jgi:uroporphyrin-III C-methyltransferase
MQSASPSFPLPRGGASLILTFRLQSKITLILGSNSLAASRAFSALEADSHVIIIAKGGLDNACEELRWRAGQSQVIVLDWDALPGTSAKASTDRDIKALESYLTTMNGIALVCVTDTVIGGDASQARTRASAAQIYRFCQSRNILVNVSDMPEFCDFSFASVHRFVDPESGQSTPLQVATTTNGQGCRLAGRIRREIVAKLPKEVGAAVEKMGKLRTMAKASDEVVDSGLDSELNEDNGVTTPNSPVPIRGSMETSSETALRRMKWVAQVSEYWPLPRLATMTAEDMQNVLSSEGMDAGSELRHFSGGILSPFNKGVRSIHPFPLPDSPLSNGKILLVGSGPGHPSLLTIATHNALTRHAHLVLSDKLVPAAVLALIPAEVEVRIARKFPGNADGAQIEMMEAAVEAARRGLTVVRVSPLQLHPMPITYLL